MRAANLNAGVLPSGARFLVSNASPKPKAVAGQVTAGHSHASSPTPHHEKNPGRDPLTLAVSKDGLTFSKAWALLSCHELAGPGQKDGCVNRYEGKVRNFAPSVALTSVSLRAQAVMCIVWYRVQAKNPAPSYPQGLVVTANGIDGLYVVATNNKEDVWVTKVEFESIEH